LDVDGSTFTMADTPENQAEYPQLAEQKPGRGFPIARIVVVFSLTVGIIKGVRTIKQIVLTPFRISKHGTELRIERRNLATSRHS